MYTKNLLLSASLIGFFGFFFFFFFFFFFLQWFDKQKAYLDSLESQLRGLVKAIELVAKHRSGVFNWVS